MAKTRKGKGKGGGRSKPCELGDLCPYKHEGPAPRRVEPTRAVQDHPPSAPAAKKRRLAAPRRLGRHHGRRLKAAADARPRRPRSAPPR